MAIVIDFNQRAGSRQVFFFKHNVCYTNEFAGFVERCKHRKVDLAEFAEGGLALFGKRLHGAQVDRNANFAPFGLVEVKDTHQTVAVVFVGKDDRTAACAAFPDILTEVKGDRRDCSKIDCFGQGDFNALIAAFADCSCDHRSTDAGDIKVAHLRRIGGLTAVRFPELEVGITGSFGCRSISFVVDGKICDRKVLSGGVQRGEDRKSDIFDLAHAQQRLFFQFRKKFGSELYSNIAPFGSSELELSGNGAIVFKVDHDCAVTNAVGADILTEFESDRIDFGSFQRRIQIDDHALIVALCHRLGNDCFADVGDIFDSDCRRLRRQTDGRCAFFQIEHFRSRCGGKYHRKHG